MDVAKGVVLAALLAAGCLSDLRARRIPNTLVLVTAAIGFVFAVAGVNWVGGLVRAGEGLLTGLAIWFPFFAFGMLGAGDVKLFAASATFLGARGAAEGALYTALYGGVLAGVFILWRLEASQRASMKGPVVVFAGWIGAMAAIGLALGTWFLHQWLTTGRAVQAGQSLALLPIFPIIGGFVGLLIAAGAGLVVSGLRRPTL